MKKEVTVCKRIIQLSEEINQLKTQKLLLRKTRIICSRSPFNPPSSGYFINMIGETERAIDERRTSIKKFITPLFRGRSFKMDKNKIELPELGSLDIYRGYIELEETVGNNIVNWVLFFKSFDIGMIKIEEGELRSNQRGELDKVLSSIKPINPSEYANDFYNTLLNKQ